MFDNNHNDTTEFDFFRELENIGASHAATALSMLLSRSVTIRVPHVQLCEYSDICNILHGPENVVAGLLVGISEDINGYILLVLDEKDARALTQAVVGDITENMTEEEKAEIETSALKEVANMLIGAYITAISELTHLKIDASVPELVFDMAGAVMNLLAVAYGETSDHALFMETEFCEESQSLFGHFFLIPDIESYKKMIQKMVNC
jgi:Chemotaxis protein CheC, inhibitor of MCP methylation